MPHVQLKLFAGRTDEQKQKIADLLTKAVMEGAGCSEKAVSVAIEEFSPEEWPEKVYRPDILESAETLYKKPGYNPFDKA
ncbi:4-oxalocrotonate tautomerase [Martelella alba]|uniref:4-oxalocrotonate tautomerase n=1 Tax=Martelella alba TaxID=2590451 RepID=A0A506UBD4_9HYPH|nr:tautomerase family protein [Martelella alba]TPW29107.1 4-oxalocrotonate tautomerase [Martelella alba]